MTVVHVETGMHLYGGALQVLMLLRGLAASPGRHVLVCPAGSEIAEAAQGVADRVVAMPVRGDLDVAFGARLYRVLREENADLVHLHSRRGADVIGGIAARLAGVPAVLSRRVDNPERRWWVALKYRLYAHVITISEGIREVLLAEGLAPERVTCVPSAVDTQTYRPGGDRAWFRREFGLADDEAVVGMAAQFIPRKGHRVLVAAAPAVLAAHPRTRFLLFGRGPGEAAIRSLVHGQGLADRFVFAGFRTDMAHIFPCLDVLAHPAYMEGLGVTLLQAAACGVPVVASAAGGIKEAVMDGESGWLISPGEPGILADRLNGLLSSTRERQEMGGRARDFVVDRFSVERMVAGNRSIYQRIVEETRRP
ncbi:N-acetyl-alpha-D-glucosaminyl L-malate synthase [wastewater metagenome]|uniref:N-acetyl-alpha-D-glucosaminyl L-malate synthase n=2 Tax=unclassified sequences TaxID=12908 RepID=A0A5B8RCC4_9ZZZZ|nr:MULTISPECIES: glycosyltransferase [Arhodomonas]QEA06789.1 N-acetyl-alpha-D-glucosaminyl L-malate synthase [uncultured organism]